MKCPYCQYSESKVIDSRPTDEDEKIRRRRECMRCGKRFTTYEIVETTPLMVVKKTIRLNRSIAINCSMGCCGHAKKAGVTQMPGTDGRSNRTEAEKLSGRGSELPENRGACNGTAASGRSGSICSFCICLSGISGY